MPLRKASDTRLPGGNANAPLPAPARTVPWPTCAPGTAGATGLADGAEAAEEGDYHRPGDIRRLPEMAGRAAREDVLDVLGEGLPAGVTSGGVLGQGPGHDRVDGRRKAGRHRARRDRILVGQAPQDRRQIWAGERLLARQQLVENRAEREQVAPGVEALSAGLLRRHVGRAPQDPPAGRQLDRIDLRHAEVHDLRLSGCQHHDVGGLDVAVHDAVGMGVLESLGHPGHRSKRLTPIEGLARCQHRFQGLATQELEGHVGRAGLGIDPDVVDHDDPGVGEGCRRAGLLQEPRLERPSVALGHRERQGDGLERHVALEDGVFGLVHHAHRSATQFSLDLVAADVL